MTDYDKVAPQVVWTTADTHEWHYHGMSAVDKERLRSERAEQNADAWLRYRLPLYRVWVDAEAQMLGRYAMPPDYHGSAANRHHVLVDLAESRKKAEYRLLWQKEMKRSADRAVLDALAHLPSP